MNIFKRARGRAGSKDIPKLCVSDSDVVDAVSLAVPIAQRGRSSSFDASSLLRDADNCEDITLNVPAQDAASTSDDNAPSEKECSRMLRIPKYYRRRSLEIPKICIHCVHLESLSSQETTPTSPAERRFSLNFGYGSSSDSDDEAEDDEDEYEDDNSVDEEMETRRRDSCPTNQLPESFSMDAMPQPATSKRRSCTMSLAQKLAAIFGAGSSTPSDCDSQRDEDTAGSTMLQVPLLKPRSSSMDAAYLVLPSPTEDRRSSLDDDLLNVPVQHRSSSVDVNLPTESIAQYKAIAHTPGGFK